MAGGALQCAMLSGRMKVKPFNIVDKLPYGIIVDWNAESKGENARIYCRGDDLPRKPERLTFHNKSEDFVLTASYDEMSGEVLPKGEDKSVAKYTIKVPANLVATGPKSVRVNFALDKHGSVYTFCPVLFFCISLSAILLSYMTSCLYYRISFVILSPLLYCAVHNLFSARALPYTS